MDHDQSPPPRPMKRRRLPIAAITAVSTTLLVHFYSMNENPSSKIIPQETHNLYQSNQQQGEEQRRLDECYTVERNWHLAMTGKSSCSNDKTFPKSWENNPAMARFFQPDCRACCMEMFSNLDPSECGCVDVCNEGGTQDQEEESCTGPCCDRYWHPDLTASQPHTCTNTYTNDGSYPTYWNDNPLMVGTSMFETADECCEKLTKGDPAKCTIVEAEECMTVVEEGNDVSITDSPTPRPTVPSTPRPTLQLTIPPFPPTPEETPRPTLPLTTPPNLLIPPTNPPNDMVQQSSSIPDECYNVERNWHLAMTGKHTCSNDKTYPKSWESITRFFQPDCHACCKEMFSKLDPSECVCIDVCNEGGGNDVTITNTPTPRPTPPTPRPTPPTPIPTLHLTIPPYLLIPDDATPRPTLHLTIPPFLLTPEETPRPTLRLTVPPNLLIPPTNPPNDMVQQSSSYQAYCSKIQRRRRCRIDSKCDWVGGSCKAAVSDSSSGSTTDDNAAVCSAGFKWHRGKPSQGSMCTNDQDYPMAWDDPQSTDKHLFNTPEECCLAHFTIEACTAVNACGEPTALSEAMPSATSSGNCSGKVRRKCKLDANCSWKRVKKMCVDTVSMQ